VLASAEKIGAASPFSVVPLDEVTGIVTDVAAGNRTVQALRRRTEILRARR
jgi:DeoR/GlpR family transcriptional regulator of sugar metabolism